MRLPNNQLLSAFVCLALLAVAAGGCVSTPPPPGPPNLAVNSSLEFWHSSGIRPQSWGLWTTPGHYYRFRVFPETQEVMDGRLALGWQADVPVNVYTGLPVEPGQTYTQSAWVKSDRDTRILLKFSAQGQDLPSELAEKERRFWQLRANRWTRVHLTGVMPVGANRFTAYFCFSEGGRYLFDRAMINQGPLARYSPGPSAQPIRQLTPVSWDAAGQPLDDQSVAFCFDDDVLSYGRLSNPTPALPKRVGAVFAQTAWVRGLGVILDEPSLPPDIAWSLHLRKAGQWERVEAVMSRYGPGLLLSFPYQEAEGIRLDLNPADPSATIPCPKIYHLQLMQ